MGLEISALEWFQNLKFTKGAIENGRKTPQLTKQSHRRIRNHPTKDIEEMDELEINKELERYKNVKKGIEKDVLGKVTLWTYKEN